MSAMSSWISRSGREALPNVRKWLGDTSECPGCPPGYPGVVGRPSRMTESGREFLPNVEKALLDIQEC